MSDDLWYMKFDVTRWQRDVDHHPLDIRGSWITICCRLWWASKRGELTLRPERWASLLYTDVDNANRIIDYLLDEKIADGKREANGYITVVSRRMIRDDKDRELNRLRQQRYYYKTKPNANLTPPNRNLTGHSKSKSKNKSNKEIKNRGVFVIPSLQEVKEFCLFRRNRVDAEGWLDYYTANGWMVGKNKMKDWKACIRNWERRDNGNSGRVGKVEGAGNLSAEDRAEIERVRQERMRNKGVDLAAPDTD